MNRNKIIFLLSFLLIGSSAFAQKLVELWRTGPQMATPESALYDSNNGVIYVSNINLHPDQKDGNGYISQLTPYGSVKRMKWITGLSGPKGMALYHNHLFVADIDELVEIDIDQSKIIHRYPAKGAKFLNDVAVSKQGDVFASDNHTNRIYRLQNNELTLWNEGKPFINVNGLFIKDSTLYLGSAVLQQCSFDKQNIKTIQTHCQNIDGLTMDENGNFVFSNWPGRIFYRKNGKLSLLWDSVKEKINTADITFAPAINLLLVPTFNDNQVVAYKIMP